MWLILAASAALAQTSPQLIAEDVHAGLLTHQEGLWLSYLAHFEAQELPVRYQSDDQPGFECAMPLVQELRQSWSSFDLVERERMTRHITPWKDDLLDPIPQLEGPEPPATSACYSFGGDNVLLTDHFRIEYEDGVSSSKAEDFGEALEYAYEKELEAGWREPEGMYRYLMLAYLVDGGGSSGYTSVEWCSGASTLMPYIVAYEGSFSSGVWYQDMAAHELNHAIQFGYQNDSILETGTTEAGWELWYWEATAVWIQEQVYPTHNIWSQYIEGYTAQPWMSMDASSQSDQYQFWHLYGMAVYNFYLEEYQGGLDTVLAHWEYVEDEVPTTSLEISEVTEELGLGDWDEVFAGWLAANTVMDYREQRYFPEVDIARRVTELPAEDSPSPGEAPWGQGANFVRIDGDLGTRAEPDLHLVFEGEDGGKWMVLLVGTDDDEVTEVVRVPVADNAADYTLSDFERHEYWWLVLASRSTRQIDYDYSWSLDRVEPPYTLPEWLGEYGPFYMSVDGEPMDPEASPATDLDEVQVGCAHAAAPGLAWGGLLVLLPLVVRRRR